MCAQGGLSLQRRCQSHRGIGALGVQSFEVMVSLTAQGNLIDLCGVVRLMTQCVRVSVPRACVRGGDLPEALGESSGIRVKGHLGCDREVTAVSRVREGLKHMVTWKVFGFVFKWCKT